MLSCTVTRQCRQRFLTHCRQLLAEIQTDPNYAEVLCRVWLDSYSHPSRKYHGVPHIVFMLDEDDSEFSQVPNRIERRLAIVGHDLVYNPLSPYNEEHSADMMEGHLHTAGLKLSQIASVKRYITSTKSHVPAQPDEAYIIDLDLAILGSPSEIYDQYVDSVRQEYAIVNDAEFFAGRINSILEPFLRKPMIYNTEPMRQKYEAQARTNLQRELGRLRE